MALRLRAARRPGGWTAELALVGVAAAWGLTFPLIQDAIRTYPEVSFIAVRFLVAAAVLAIPYGQRTLRLGWPGWLAGFLLGGLLTVGYLFQTFGLAHTTASNSGFITGLYVIWTPLLAWLVLRQPLKLWATCCVVVAVVGLLLLSGAGGTWSPIGDGLTLGCSLSFAAHILVTGWAIQRFPVGPIVVVQLATCGTVSLLAGMSTGTLVLPTEADVWWAVLFTAVVASALGYLIQSFAQRRVPTTRTAMILAAEPVFAAIFGYWLAGDRLTVLGIVGAAGMLAAVVAMEASPEPREAGTRQRRQARAPAGAAISSWPEQ